ncbi:MAG: hypothetical protein AB8B92_08085 [Gammaproteobacteria bacterium]
MQFVRNKHKYHCRWLIFFIFLLALFSSVGFSANALKLVTLINIDAIEGYGLTLHDVALRLDSQHENMTSYSVQIGSAVLPDNRGRIKNILLQCKDGVISKETFACNDGELSFNDPIASANKAKIIFHRNELGDLNIKLSDFNLAGGSASLSVKMNDEVWRAAVKSKNVSFSKLQKVLPSFPELLSEGIATSDIDFLGKGTSLLEIKGDALIRELAFANEDSTVVGENVSVKLAFSSKRELETWQSKFNSTTFKGELYFDPVFIDANANAKDLFGKLNWRVGSNEIELASLHYEDANAVVLKLDTVIDFEKNEAIAPIEVDIQYAAFPNVYDDYMLPFLLDTNISDLVTKGSLSGSMLLDEGRVVDTDLSLNHLTFEDKQKRFSISKLNGNIGWGKRYSGKEYEFSFDSADIYKVRLDASHFSFSNDAQALILKQSVSVPILDGAVNIESFLVKNPGSEDQSVVMDISLTPVSMSKLSIAFGWPEMNGNLAGYAPNVSYKQGDVDIQGALLIRGFGGTTTIHNLSANDLFSITPKLSADLKLNNLDLSSLTETFSFGEITGRLEGSVTNLQFVNWSPVQFNAWFGTPEKDKSRHRISQTAVDNLTQVGNGGANILSKSFLKFFDSFGYDKLGLGCTLKNNTCKMRGVNVSTEDNSQGFYIVKGSGVPRIDIVGFANEVSWPVLIARLKRVVNTKDVIVN